MSLVVKSVPSVFTEIQQHKAQFEQLVGCLIHCSMIKTESFAEKLNPDQPAQESSKQLT